MKLAVLSDVHGGYVALQACLERAFQEQVDAFVFLGDYLGELAYPRRTMELLYESARQYQCYFIKGNKEDYWLNYHEKGVRYVVWKEVDSTTGMLYYVYHQLKEKDFKFFGSLELSKELAFEGLPTLTICHGSPESTRQKLLPKDGKTQDILEKSATDIILCGHTHRQGTIFLENQQGGIGIGEAQEQADNNFSERKRILNPGSVGMPLESGGKAQFLIMHGENGQWREEFISLDYDVERVIAELEEEHLFEIAPGWCTVTKKALREGKPSHGDVLARAMTLCKETTGVCDWPDIPEVYWEQAIEEMVE